MMKVAVVLVLCVLVATVHSIPTKEASQEFIKRHIKLMRLYVRPTQPNLETTQRQIGNKFNFEEAINKFTNPNSTRQFHAAYKQGRLLPRGEVFNYNNHDHLQQAIQLFDLLYNAKDYDTFYRATCWARDRVNDGVFIYALSVSLLNRPDTQGVALFTPSEVYPSLYIDSRIVDLAQITKERGQKEVILKSNYTNYEQPNYRTSQPFHFNRQSNNGYQNQNGYIQEDTLSYYTEDINLNQQFAYERLKNPFWLSVQNHQNKTVNQTQNNGENYAYYLHQILARYNLERYANNLPNVEHLQFNGNIKAGYYPQMVYMNGQPIPGRPRNYNMKNAKGQFLQQLQNIDRRISCAVDSGRVKAANGTNVNLTTDGGIKMLGNIVQNNNDSLNNQYYGAQNGYYGLLDQCRKVVGSLITGKNGNAPTAIDNDNTAQRDPAFYQCLSRVVTYFQNFKNRQKPYSQEQLSFSGVKISSVTVQKMVTYFRKTEHDLFNAIDYKPDESTQDFLYKAQKVHLNTKPFNYQILVNSVNDTDAIVRVFIGPKYDFQGRQLNIENSRKNFVEIDRFKTKLSSGENSILRNSQQSTKFASRQMKAYHPMDNLWQALKGGPPFYYDDSLSKRRATFPANLILPKGSSFGQEYLFAVTFNPYQGNKTKENEEDTQYQATDDKPQGFPFDRIISEVNLQQAENINIQTVKIYHKTTNELINIYRT